MMLDLPDLRIKHPKIENPESPIWDLQVFAFIGGTKINRQKKSYSLNLLKLKIIEHRIKWLLELKEYFESQFAIGISKETLRSELIKLKSFFSFCDEKSIQLISKKDIEFAFFNFAEFLFLKSQKSDGNSAYYLCLIIGNVLSSITENNEINVANTRLKEKRRSQRAVSRNADKQSLEDSSKLGCLVYDICINFKPSTLVENRLPILVNVRDSLTPEQINLTPFIRHGGKINDKSKIFPFSHSKAAFNNRVAAECLFFLAMTEKNSAETFKLEIEEFHFKPLGQHYQVRKYKNRKGGEVTFTIPKPYKLMFEEYLKFINQYAIDSKWLFPYIDINGNYRQRNSTDWNFLRQLVKKYHFPWVTPSSFRKTGLNLLLRLSSDEKTAADYGNHAVETFRQNYELPSQQRALVEITRFWNDNDPLTHGKPNLSLFNTSCNGVAEAIKDKPNLVVKPDCLTPSGCLWCKHFRDDDSLDYVWNLFSYRYLKIIESSSYFDEKEKPSNLVIDRLSKKIEWFQQSETINHSEWYKEAEKRIQEGDYHPNWEQKIMKYEA